MTWEAIGTGSHLALLVQAIQQTEGPILELGAGEWSTPVLRQLAFHREVVTVENSDEWRRHVGNLEGGNLRMVPALTPDLRDRHWGVVLVDNAPEIDRVPALDHLDADIFVTHDSEVSELLPPELYPNYEGPRRAIRQAMTNHRYFYEDKSRMPRTALSSNTVPLPYGPAPIALFAYNRPDHLRQVIASLQANPESSNSDLYIFCDGPGGSAEVEEVRRIAYGTGGFAAVIVHTNEENVGPGHCVIRGMDKLMTEHQRVIKVEDDSVVAPHFLAYANAALDIYADDDRAAAVSGFCYPGEDRDPTYFVCHDPGPAFATWRRAWARYNADAPALVSALEAEGLMDRLNFDGAYPYSDMLRSVADGTTPGGYDIRWAASIALHDQLTLFPDEPLMVNIGYGSGAHCAGVAEDPHAAPMRADPLIPERIPVSESAEGRESFARHLRSL